jgi:hypothetical protein
LKNHKNLAIRAEEHRNHQKSPKPPKIYTATHHLTQNFLPSKAMKQDFKPALADSGKMKNNFGGIGDFRLFRCSIYSMTKFLRKIQRLK